MNTGHMIVARVNRRESQDFNLNFRHLYSYHTLFQPERVDPRYVFGEGEKEQFGAEMMRLGRKYVKAVSFLERRILHRSLYYHYFEGMTAFKLAVDAILIL